VASPPAPEGDAWLSQPDAGDLVNRSDQAIAYWRNKKKITEDEWYRDEGGRYFVLRSAVERVAATMDRRRRRPQRLARQTNPAPAPAEVASEGFEAIDLRELSKQLGAVTRDRDHLEAENARLRQLSTDLTAAIQRYLGE
jgi:hypothetical protein